MTKILFSSVAAIVLCFSTSSFAKNHGNFGTTSESSNTPALNDTPVSSASGSCPTGQVGGQPSCRLSHRKGIRGCVLINSTTIGYKARNRQVYNLIMDGYSRQAPWMCFNLNEVRHIAH